MDVEPEDGFSFTHSFHTGGRRPARWGDGVWNRGGAGVAGEICL